MKSSNFQGLSRNGVLFTAPAVAQDNMKGMDMPMKQMEKMPTQSTLQPAEGASVKDCFPQGRPSHRMAIRFRLSSR